MSKVIDVNARWILPWHYKHIKPKLNKPSANQMRRIRTLLYLPKRHPFARCQGRVKKRIREFEARGDFSHSGANHVCDECRCHNRAGQGTLGNFYGLGPETGHRGVGWCYQCEMAHRSGKALGFAIQQFEAIQKYGSNAMSSSQYQVTTEKEAQLAELNIRAREDMQLAVDTLEQFKKDLDQEKKDEVATLPILRDIEDRVYKLTSDDLATKDVLQDIKTALQDAILVREQLTEMTKSGPVPMADKTKIELKLKVADVLSKIKVRHMQLDSNDYIHYDELAIRIPEHIALGRRSLMRLKEILKNPDEHDARDPIDIVHSEFVDGTKEIWNNCKTGLKK